MVGFRKYRSILILHVVSKYTTYTTIIRVLEPNRAVGRTIFQTKVDFKTIPIVNKGR